MSPTLSWGLGTGLCVAVVDAVTLLASRALGPASEADFVIAWLNILANVVLFSTVGMRVGRLTGLVRSAAEAGVLAALVAATVNVGLAYALPQPGAGPIGPLDVVRTFAENVAIGGVLAWASGLYVTRGREAGSGRGLRR